MKRAVIGGFFSIIGSIWAFIIITYSSNFPTSTWSSPFERIERVGLMPYFMVALAVLAIGIMIMVIEFFKSEK